MRIVIVTLCFACLGMTLPKPNAPRQVEVSMEWTASERALGYTLWVGTNSGQYTMSVDVGNVTNITLLVWTAPIQYFAVTAWNNFGQSGESPEARYPVPYDTVIQVSGLVIKTTTNLLTGWKDEWVDSPVYTNPVNDLFFNLALPTGYITRTTIRKP